MMQIKNKFPWAMSVIPQSKENPTPRTVLFGANVCVFKNTDARQKAAWKFIEYFVSKDVTAFWATRTGYLPVRKSAIEVPLLKEFLKKHSATQQTVDAIPYAYPEPSVRGWQEVRSAIERIISDIIAKRQTPEQSAQTLQEDATHILSRR
jgi:multiple sugar transport system substrate-binding protein